METPLPSARHLTHTPLTEESIWGEGVRDEAAQDQEGAGGPEADGAEANAETTPAAPRKRFRHPLDRFPDELQLWVDDEARGSLSQMARINMRLPQDSWERACWRAMLAMEHSVASMPIRNRRRLYMLMRSLSEPSPDSNTPSTFGPISPHTSGHLVPELGLTFGHLSVFHILHGRTQYTKVQSLGHQAAPICMPMKIDMT